MFQFSRTLCIVAGYKGNFENFADRIRLSSNESITSKYINVGIPRGGLWGGACTRFAHGEGPSEMPSGEFKK